ncbi:MAG: hypothetical protein ABIQ31_27655 [Ferruginibacter sp.]
MKKLIVFLVVLVLTVKLNAQNIDWKNATNWQLYNTREIAAFDFTLATLKEFRSIPLNLDTMQAFLEKTEQWPKEKYSMWSGLYVVTCELPNAGTRNIEISVYGGFFYDDKTKRYYQLPLEIRNDWLEYLSNKSSTFSL